jgi:hypothetical protein
VDWGPIIAAGVNIASGMLADETNQQSLDQSKENLILNLQDNERDRAAQLERQQLANQAMIESANIGLQGQKKRILGDVLLQQGQGQEKLMLEAFRAAANKPERFNTAAQVLANVLSR